MEKTLLIDGNSIMNRAFYATMGRMMKTPSGISTNAVYGFLQIFFRVIEDEAPTKIIVAFDLKGELKRSKIYPEYKAGRHKTPEDLVIQFPIIKEILVAMGIKILEKPGVEADDILGAVAKKEKERVVILTGDKDYFQLIDEKIVVKYPKTKMGKTEYIRYDISKIIEEYEIEPDKMKDLKALMGDSSDNIPGVKGIGEKTAIKLIKENGSIENLYENIEKGEIQITKANLNKLIEGKEEAFLSYKLGEIEVDMEVEKELGFVLSDIKYVDWKNEKVYAIFKRLSLNRFLEKMPDLKNIDKKEELNTQVQQTLWNTVEADMDTKIDTEEENSNADIVELRRNIEKYPQNTYTYLETKDVKIQEQYLNELKNIKEIVIFPLSRKIISASNPLELSEQYWQRDNIIEKLILNGEMAQKKLDRLYHERIANIETKYVIVLIGEKIYTLDVEDENLKKILEDENISKLTHGIREFKVEMIENGINIKNVKFDTKLATYILNSDIGQYNVYQTAIRELGDGVSEYIYDYCKIEEEEKERYNEILKEQRKIIVTLRELLQKVDNQSKSLEQIKDFSSLIEYVIPQDILEKNERICKKIETEIEKIKRETPISYLQNKIIEFIEEIRENIGAKKKDFTYLNTLLKTYIQSYILKEKSNSIRTEKIIIPYIIKAIYRNTKKKIEKQKMEKLYYEIELPNTEVLANMQYNGIYLNVKRLNEIRERLLIKQKELTEKIEKIAEEKININSVQQIGKLLFEKLNLPVIKKTKTGYSTDIDILKKIKDKHVVVEYILEYREITKLISTYVDSILNEVNRKTQRVHSNFHQTVTATGRISSTEPNMQNIPARREEGREIRGCFEAEGERVLVSADYSQIELRVLAAISKDEKMLNAFKEGQDIHRMTASTMFDIPIEEVTDEYRGYAKAVNFGIIYGISDFGLSENTGVQIKEAKKYIEDYLKKYVKVAEYMENIKNEAKEKGYVETSYGRRRYIENINSANYIVREAAKRMAMNAPIQGTAADITKIAMNNIYKRLQKENIDCKMLLQIHDEIILETTKKEMEKVKQILKQEMEKASKLEVSMKVEVKVSKEMKK